jgi:AcrR family transcriptional regulator
LRLFANQGYVKTSTRELAEAAQVNIAAISYYFGDKAGLYRAVFFEPMGDAERDIHRYNGAGLSLREALRGFFDGFLEPLKQGDAARLCMKLHYREMIDPTGLWQEQVTQGIQPMHEALLVVLCRHLKIAAPDDHVQRLAVCLAGLGVHMHMCRDVTDQVAPRLNQGRKAIDAWSECLVRFGLAMVRAETERRRAAAAPA